MPSLRETEQLRCSYSGTELLLRFVESGHASGSPETSASMTSQRCDRWIASRVGRCHARSMRSARQSSEIPSASPPSTAMFAPVT
jgi:hypothetical protein